MKMFINYLKGIAVIVYHIIPALLYGSAIYAMYSACIYTGGIAAAWLIYGLISMTISVTLTFIRGATYFDSIFRKNSNKDATADKGKKNF